MNKNLLILLLIAWHLPAGALYQSEPDSGISVREIERLPDQSVIEVRIDEDKGLSSVGGSMLIARAVCQLKSVRGFQQTHKLEETTTGGVTRMRFGFTDSEDATVAVLWPAYAGTGDSQEISFTESFCRDIEKLFTTRCVIQPPFLSVDLPESGFYNQASGKSCDLHSDIHWEPYADSKDSWYLNTEGPGGSGRYWTIWLGRAEQGQAAPVAGVCIETSTVGWRTLQQFDQTPLPWLSDQDTDGLLELIIWSSFYMNNDPFTGEPALMAWVYRNKDGDRFTLDMDLSRSLAKQISAAYRRPVSSNPRLEQSRTRIARALEDFAQGQCSGQADRQAVE